MGKTAFAGPVYGAKSLLWAVGPATGSSGASTSRPFTNAASMVIPPYEDWYITEFAVSCSTCSSVGNSFILKSKGGSTTGTPPRFGTPGAGSTITQTLSNINAGTSTSVSTWATITASPGEYEGAWVPAGSTLYVVSSGVNPPAQLMWNVRGFIRYVDSTRAS